MVPWLENCLKQLTFANKFANDTKLGHRIESDQDRETLHRCIDNLLVWAEDLCMEFKVKSEVLVNQDLKPSLQCAEALRGGIYSFRTNY